MFRFIFHLFAALFATLFVTWVVAVKWPASSHTAFIFPTTTFPVSYLLVVCVVCFVLFTHILHKS